MACNAKECEAFVPPHCKSGGSGLLATECKRVRSLGHALCRQARQIRLSFNAASLTTTSISIRCDSRMMRDSILFISYPACESGGLVFVCSQTNVVLPYSRDWDAVGKVRRDRFCETEERNLSVIEVYHYQYSYPSCISWYATRPSWKAKSSSGVSKRERRTQSTPAAGYLAVLDEVNLDVLKQKTGQRTQQKEPALVATQPSTEKNQKKVRRNLFALSLSLSRQIVVKRSPSLLPGFRCHHAFLLHGLPYRMQPHPRHQSSRKPPSAKQPRSW
jgi:hypothetical protein